MGEKQRKLMTEVEKTLKRISEGVEAFDDIWEKVHATDNANQREKLEGDLKKEIKKLQRYREQVKQWAQSNDIKDKAPLYDARKRIEREMERFKMCEKETKTKAYSKEGLVQEHKLDPKEQAKKDAREWINTAVESLNEQIETFEADIEGLGNKKGKQRNEKLQHLEESVTRHKQHVQRLEQVLRLMDNDQISPENVNELKEMVDDYLESNQERFEEFADPDEFYMSLDLDTLESKTQDIPPNQPPVKPDKKERKKDKEKDKDKEKEKEKESCSTAATSESSTTTAASTSSETRQAVSNAKSSDSSGATAGATVSTAASASGGASAKEAGKVNATAAPSDELKMPAGNNKAKPPGKQQQQQQQQQPQQTPAPAQQAQQQPQQQLSTGAAGSGAGPAPVLLSQYQAQPQLQQQQPQAQQQNQRGRGPTNTAAAAASSPPQATDIAAAQGSAVPPSIPTPPSAAAATQQGQAGAQGSAGVPAAAPSPAGAGASQQQRAPFGLQQQLQQAPPQQQQQHHHHLGGAPAASGGPAPATAIPPPGDPRTASQGWGQLQGETLQHVGMAPEKPAAGSRDTGTETIEDDLRLLDLAPVNEALNASQQVQDAASRWQLTDAATASRALDMGFRHAPQGADRAWDRRTRQRVSVRPPETFPMQHPTSLEDPAVYEKMGAEALFFAFYFLQASTAQLHAAAELKRCGWRFHKRFNTWFARLSAPRQVTDEYEVATYVYFDMHPQHEDESYGFCQRVKENFTFEYAHLSQL